MSEHSLLPHEVVLLSAAWHRSSHFPTKHLVGDDWNDYYEAQLEKTMAEWLQEGLLGWQVDTRRPSAFAPVAHRIGTAREDMSYVESLARLVAALIPERDHFYRQPADAYKAEQSDISLGICLGNAAALAVKGLAAQLPRDRQEARWHYRALMDALTLVQIVKPFNLEEPLCCAWEILFEGICPADELGTAYALSLRRQFVLAMYPLAHTGMQQHRIGKLIDRIFRRGRGKFSSAGWSDLQTTHAMFFGGADTYSPVPDQRFERPVTRAPGPFWKSGWNAFLAPT